MPSNPTFVFGDRDARPPKANRAVEHIIGDMFTTQGFVGLGIFLQALFSFLLPHPYSFVPGAILIAIATLPNILRLVGLYPKDKEAAVIVGKTAAYLDFADPRHANKQPGSPAFTDYNERRVPPLALMLIGSQCRSKFGAVQPEFKEMGEVFASMIEELRTAPPEDDVGFLNAEFYMHGGESANNSNMVCIYWRSYQHMYRFAHKEGGKHWPAWNKYRTLQREQHKLGTEIGIWHEVFEISNAEAIYHNMPRMGLGDMWDAVRTMSGQVVYRNSLVVGSGSYATSDGRMGYEREYHTEKM
ncbi:hypothetical protein JB92DRAFT_3134760 [Gautieria morchelliformis]|nr:hypothetical protein JB92DRAFT_3134760 [Gautieria morchelliformis]